MSAVAQQSLSGNYAAHLRPNPPKVRPQNMLRTIGEMAIKS